MIILFLPFQVISMLEIPLELKTPQLMTYYNTTVKLENIQNVRKK